MEQLAELEYHPVARRGARKKERMTPCACCDYPISQRHHLYKVAEYGEHDMTVQLCANCHELFHLCYNSQTINHVTEEAFQSNHKNLPVTRAQLLWGHAILRLGFEDKRIAYIVDLVRKVIEIEQGVR